MHLNAGDLSSVLNSDLSTCGWDGSVEPYPNMPAQQYAMMSLSKSLIKKFHNDEQNDDRDNKAQTLFTKVNEACGKYIYGNQDTWEAEAVALGEAKDFIYRFFYRNDSQGDQLLTLRSIAEGFGVGNGANIGSKTTSFYSKVANGLMSATSSELYDLYVQAIFFDPVWSRSEAHREKTFGHNIVKNSRLSFVPKDAKISRTICTEPVLNMLFQKGIASCLERELHKSLGIDFSVQPIKNQTLCRIGSVNGKYGTIDLSSASDSMSLSLVREFFPADVVKWLERTRCPSTVLPDGKIVDLHMVSSMGNAFTFPLQTLFFSALVFGAYRVHNVPLVRSEGKWVGNFSVFGDDIIVLQRCYNTVVRLLEICGFTVNKDKSFNQGLFRESCGHDYYCGYNVRGVYIKKLRHAGDFYSAINRLLRWSARHRVLIPNTIALLSRGLRFLPVPFAEGDACGIKVPLSMVKRKILSKFTGGVLYRYLSPVNYVVRIPELDDPRYDMKARKLRRHIPDWIYNPDGLLLSLLHGSIRNGQIGLRSNVARKTVTRQRYSSSWDWINVDYGENRSFGEDWKVFVWLSLPCEQAASLV
jgi:hypothetical protein